MSQLEIKDLHVSIESKEILQGVNLTIKQGEIHAIMGPNGTGKSTLAYTLMGHPNYTVTKGEVLFKDQNILELEPDERSRLGIFLAFQYPVAIPGVTVANFLRTALNARRRAVNKEDKGIPIPEFRKMLKEQMDLLKMDNAFAGRYLNDGFSGGEKKRAEILQMATLKPEMAILDETDFRPRHRCAACRLGRSQRPDRSESRSARHHALSAFVELYQAALRPRDDGRTHRRIGRTRFGAFARRAWLRLDS